MARVCCLEQVALRVHAQHDVDNVRHRNVVDVRAVPAAPAEMIADLLLRDAGHRMIERLDPHQAIFLEGGKPHLDADAIP